MNQQLTEMNLSFLLSQCILQEKLTKSSEKVDVKTVKVGFNPLQNDSKRPSLQAANYR